MNQSRIWNDLAFYFADFCRISPDELQDSCYRQSFDSQIRRCSPLFLWQAPGKTLVVGASYIALESATQCLFTLFWSKFGNVVFEQSRCSASFIHFRHVLLRCEVQPFQPPKQSLGYC